MDKNKETLEKARNYAFLLLKFRLRSENELRQRLKNKKFNPEIIQKTISYLKEKGFLDDAYFARAWIESRIKKPLGLRRLRQELKLKGIAAEIIENSINETKENYVEEDIVRGIIKDKFNKIRDIDPQKAKRRIYAYLLRRGFSPETVTNVISQFK